MDMKIDKRTLIADISLVAAVLVVALLLLAIPKQKGGTVEVLRGGESVGKYSLQANRVIEINDENGGLLNTVCIENGKVFVKHASCTGGDCVRHPAIYKEGQCIVCLPNAVTVVIRGSGGIDGVTG